MTTRLAEASDHEGKGRAPGSCRLLEILDASPEVVEDARVGCGGCPVGLLCAAGVGGTGWRFDCCGSTMVELPEQGIELIVDCARNGFHQRADVRDVMRGDMCPLCSGDVVETVLRELDRGRSSARILLTIHARVPARERLRLWRRRRAVFEETP